MPKGNQETAKRIAIVRHNYYDLLVRREAETLLNAGYELDVICLPGKSEANEPTINGVRLHTIPLVRKKAGLFRYLYDYLAFCLLVAWKLTRLHLERPFAAIQVNNMPDFLVFATLIPRLLGAKVTLVMYEPTPELWATKYNAPWLIKWLEWFQKRALSYAHTVFAVTEQMKQGFVGRGCPASKISVILNAPEPRFLKSDTPARAKENEHFTLICHGAIEERYGHDTMLEAVARLRAEIPGIRLRILGRGSYQQDFTAQIAAMGLEEQVQYLGFVPLDEMIAELARADAGIVAQKSSPYSNLVHTGKMYDYFTFGLPVLASRLGAVEAYFDDNSICFFEPGDVASLAQGILELYRNPARRQTLVENSQKLYRQYQWAQQKEIYLSAYRALIG
ncbi:MAG: glycosyltransferase family 4 protein [Chloroflexota bacterium]